MHYQMWHVETRNLMDDFDDEAEALDAARAYLTPDENGIVVDVLLIAYDESGEPSRAIEGEELARLVFGSTGDQLRHTA
jgi:hypothetical protein